MNHPIEEPTPESEKPTLADLYADFNAADYEIDRGARLKSTLKHIGESALGVFKASARAERADRRELKQAESFTAWEARQETKRADKEEMAAMDAAWKEQNRAERAARPERAKARREARHTRWQERKELLSVTVSATKTAASEIGAATLEAIRAARTMVHEHKEQNKK